MRILFVLILALVSCGPTAEKESPPDSTIDFVPQVEDHQIPLAELAKANPRVMLIEGHEIRGYEVMNTIENLMVLGDRLNEPQFRELGHSLAQEFYGQRNQVTEARVKQSPYLEAALGEKKVPLMNLLETWLSEATRTEGAIERTIPQIKGFSNAAHRTPLNQLGQLIEILIKEFMAVALEYNASAQLVNEGRRKINESYGAVLESLYMKLGMMSDLQPAASNIEVMLSLLDDLSRIMKQEQMNIAKARNELISTQNLVNEISGIKTAEDGVKVVLNLWLLLNEKGRKENFETSHPRIYSALMGYTNKEIEEIRENVIYSPKKMMTRNIIKSVIYWFGVGKFQNDLTVQLNKGLIKQFELEIQKMILAIPELIGNSFLSGILELRKNLEDYHRYFVEKTEIWATKSLFGGDSYISGLEFDEYLLKSPSNENRNFVIPKEPQRSATSSSVLGASLAMAGERLKKFKEFEHKDFSSSEYFRVVISVLNKIPALGGFRQVDNVLYNSFHLQKLVSDPFLEKMDLKIQLDHQTHYAVPDQIILSGPFAMDVEAMRGQPINYGPMGQAELLRGLSLVLEYFRDWQVNGFDEKMSHFKMEDVIPKGLPEHLKSLLLFPKDKIFEYILGVASVILTNLEKEKSNLIMFGMDGLQYQGHQSEAAKSAASVTAAVVSTDTNNLKLQIRTEEVAKTLMALTRFLHSIEGIENSRSESLNKIVNGERKNLTKLQVSKPKLKLLISMMANFLSAKARPQKGLIWSEISLKTNEGRPGRIIHQLLSIQALLEAHELLKMESYLAAAIEIFFNLKKSFFFADKAAFSLASQSFEPLQYYEIVEFIKTLHLLSQHSNSLKKESSEQIIGLLEIFKKMVLVSQNARNPSEKKRARGGS